MVTHKVTMNTRLNVGQLGLSYTFPALAAGGQLSSGFLYLVYVT